MLAMARKAIDPTRRCLPPQEWPAPDRRVWEQALRAGNPFSGIGLASHWRPLTRKRVASSYGRWLGYLQQAGELLPDETPAQRITESRLRGFARHLAAQVAPVTLANRLVDLGEAIRVMWPGADLSLLRLAAARMKARAEPSRDKRARYVHPQVLVALGLTLLRDAEAGGTGDPIRRALRARDGLMILITATRGLRLSNLAMIRIGRHLVRHTEGYALYFRPGENKNHRAHDVTLPTILTEPMDHYLEAHRPVLLQGGASDKLWLSYKGTEIKDHSIYQRFCLLTKQHLGKRVNPHLFRDCGTTAIAIEDPQHIGIASTILHHADPRIRDMHYNHAQGIEAMRQMQADIAARRREIRRYNHLLTTRKRS